MSLVEADDVPDARSFCSTSRTRNPRPAASRAIPVPLMPPPTTARSKASILIPFHTAGRGGLRKLKMRSCAARAIGDDAAIATGERPMDYRDRHVVVTGGTGALGTAVVTALVAAGAVCHVPYILAAEADRFPLRHHAQVRLVADVELTEEAAVARLYDGMPTLWASIHIAGGFAMAPVAETTKSALMQQVDMN